MSGQGTHKVDDLTIIPTMASAYDSDNTNDASTDTDVDLTIDYTNGRIDQDENNLIVLKKGGNLSVEQFRIVDHLPYTSAHRLISTYNNSTLPVDFHTVLYPYKEDTDKPTNIDSNKITVTENGNPADLTKANGIKVIADNKEDIFLFSTDSVSRTYDSEIEFQGKGAYLRKINSETKEIGLSLIHI